MYNTLHVGAKKQHGACQRCPRGEVTVPGVDERPSEGVAPCAGAPPDHEKDRKLELVGLREGVRAVAVGV